MNQLTKIYEQLENAHYDLRHSGINDKYLLPISRKFQELKNNIKTVMENENGK
jgi:hypothetical protein